VHRLPSILSRIMLLHGVAVVITAIFMPIALYWALNADVEDLQRWAMRTEAESIARHLSPRPDGHWSLDLPAGLRSQFSEAYGRYAYAVLDMAGKVLFSSRKDGTPIFPDDDRSADLAFLETRRDDRIIFGASLQMEADGRTVWVQVGEDLSHRGVLVNDVVANFYERVGWITVPILLMMLATDIVIFRRAVQPLLVVSKRAEQIGPTRIDVRLPVADIPREIRPLVVAVNRAFDRLEQGFRRQREFTADAAHELRTPLAILRTRIETLPDRHAAEALHRDVEGMSRVVSQLLDAAEIETLVVAPGERADLREVCAEVAEFIAPLALAQGKAIALTGTEAPVPVDGNAEMLSRAVRNLVENALKHAPAGTDVEIVVGADATIAVLDHGEGIPPAKRELIFERFWRRDRRGSGGAGLGLSIVKRIMDAHGGTVAVADAPAGGALFTLHLGSPHSRPAGIGDPSVPDELESRSRYSAWRMVATRACARFAGLLAGIGRAGKA
jgi:signal transduction histidine kinase